MYSDTSPEEPKPWQNNGAASVDVRDHGYKQVASLMGGTFAWKQRGLLVEI